jgi:hypothetical protein
VTQILIGSDAISDGLLENLDFRKTAVLLPAPYELFPKSDSESPGFVPGWT